MHFSSTKWLHAGLQAAEGGPGGLQWEDHSGAPPLQPVNQRLGRSIGELDALFTPHASELGVGCQQAADNLRCSMLLAEMQ